MIRIRSLVLFLVSMAVGLEVFADERDEAIFGGDSSSSTPKTIDANQSVPERASDGKIDPQAAQTNHAQSFAKGLNYDQISVGARIDLQTVANKLKDQKYAKSSAENSRFFDVYLDGNLPQESRAFLRLRFYDTPTQSTQSGQSSATSTSNGTAQKGVLTQVDEAWVRTRTSSWFLTLGKQHLRWGSSHFWNPTDFLAAETRNPFEDFDQRLGLYMIKAHFPVESLNHNYYLVLSYHDVQSVNEAKIATRAEWALNQNSETSLTYSMAQGGRQGIGLDFSSGLGDFDLTLEAALQKHPKQTYFEGHFSPDTLEVPSPLVEDSKWWFQGVSGLNYTKNYTETRSLTVGLEYFYNQLGYQDRDLEFYALLQGQGQPLKLGQHYWGVFVRLPQPLSFNNSTVILSAIENQDDQTTTARLSNVWTIMQGLSLETFLTRCFGDSGELCFSLPEKYRTAVEQLQTINAISPQTNSSSSINTEALLRPKREASIGLRLVAEF